MKMPVAVLPCTTAILYTYTTYIPYIPSCSLQVSSVNFDSGDMEEGRQVQQQIRQLIDEMSPLLASLLEGPMGDPWETR